MNTRPVHAVAAACVVLLLLGASARADLDIFGSYYNNAARAAAEKVIYSCGSGKRGMKGSRQSD